MVLAIIIGIYMYMYVRISCMIRVRVMVFNSNCSNISVISGRSVLLVEETEVPGKNPPTCRKFLTNFII